MNEAAIAGDELIRVLIADDQALFRRGLYVVLGAEDNIEVVAEAQDGVEAVAKAEELAPDVILMDIRMPRLSGIEATRHIRAVLPGTRIVMLTVSDQEADLFEAIKAGANGYLLKEIPADEVASAMQAVAQGDSLISPSMASKLLREFNALAELAAEKGPVRATERPAGQEGGQPPPAAHLLTARELEVLKLVARGHEQPRHR